ncbi:glycosyltransferase family 8 protein [Mycena amicta]|nr:glycosyltransferase family 8 protein [Mycena amicta]
MSMQQPSYDFTPAQDWFSFNKTIWAPFLAQLYTSLDHPPRALEIGSWEGRSAVYLLESFCNTPRSELVCIDHFDLHRTPEGRERYRKIQHNLTIPGFPFRVIDEFSTVALYRLLEEEIERPKGGFDFVYIDGSHEADDTFLDAELAWRLTRQGAVVIFDDYEWSTEPPESIHHPKRGIDAFLLLHDGEYQVLHRGYQIIIRKTGEMRIGFLTKKGDTAADIYESAPINIAFCTDSAYAMPTAVALSSIVQAATETRRMAFYIVDLGLSAEDKQGIKSAVPVSDRVTISFIALPEGSKGLGEATWAKIDALSQLPVERILFLDADILVRHDLGELWRVDLHGKTFAAARDIGLPMGHPEIPRQPYFNAGVLLIDMTRMRSRLASFLEFIETWPQTTYEDQDALNVFFHGDWLEISVDWNATGLGTYAARKDEDRAPVWPNGELDGLHEHAKIVHFTGPVHPSMAHVLDEYNQPWTSKPWGFAGAPGNPFAVEWRKVLSKTAWKDWFESDEYKKEVESAEAKSMEEGAKAFKTRVAAVRDTEM